VERRGAPAYIRRCLEASLQRLRTDVIDLYQHHEEDEGTAVEETIGTLEELVAEGKIRAYGTSNYRVETLERVKAIASAAFVSEQSEYSWLRRSAEEDLLPACERLGLGFIPYFPLGRGLLTGKVSAGRPPAEGTRLYHASIPAEDLQQTERLRGWAADHGVSLLEVAIGGLAAVPAVASVIAGATRAEQVRANAAAGSWEPTAAQLAELRSL
jgi:aryl-alcohol dehydrogenase-like predicted oxidoreductase